jgi:CCR4-NOT transcription complex subunit 9
MFSHQQVPYHHQQADWHYQAQSQAAAAAANAVAQQQQQQHYGRAISGGQNNANNSSNGGMNGAGSLGAAAALGGGGGGGEHGASMIGPGDNISEENRRVLDWIAQVLRADTREAALLELSKKREQVPELALILWHSFGAYTRWVVYGSSRARGSHADTRYLQVL